MTHAMIRFEHVAMPRAVPQDDLSTGYVDSSLVDSIGTTYNYHGDSQTRLRRHTFSHRGKYVGEDSRLIDENGEVIVDEGDVILTAAQSISADLASQVDELKALRGVWGQLWRERISDGQLTWRKCRLLGVQHVERVDNAERVAEVESRFETNDTFWRGEEVQTASVSATNGVLTSVSVPNNGVLSVPDAILRVECTSGTITQVEISGDGIHIIWTGTLTVGQVLEIDSGLSTVEKDGANAYSGFALQDNHTYDDWFVLERYDNTIWIKVTGGNADFDITYYWLWP